MSDWGFSLLGVFYAFVIARHLGVLADLFNVTEDDPKWIQVFYGREQS